MNPANGACQRCAYPHYCPGPAGHQLHDQVLTLPLSPGEFATLLHSGLPAQVPLLDAGVVIDLLRRLPVTELEQLAELLGTPMPTLVHALTLPEPPTDPGDVPVLHALLLHLAPHGAAPAALAEHLNWTLARLTAAAHTLRDDPHRQPCGWSPPPPATSPCAPTRTSCQPTTPPPPARPTPPNSTRNSSPASAASSSTPSTPSRAATDSA